MIPRILNFLPVFLVSLLSITPAAQATDYYMSPDGNDSNDGKSVDRPWRTMNKVMDMQNSLGSGDIVYFRGGDYVLTQSNDRTYYPLRANGVTYKNYQNEKPYIVQDRRVPSHGGNIVFPTMITISGNNIVLDGINLRQTPESHAIAQHDKVIEGLRYGNAQGMSVEGNNVTVKNCSITNFSASAMGGGGQNFLMEHCYLATSGHGSYITGQGGTYRFNVYDGINGYFNQFGIQLQFPTSQGNRIYGNLMMNGQSAGVVLSGGASNNEIFNNVIVNAGNKLRAETGEALVPGKAIAFVCYKDHLPRDNKIFNNTFIGKTPGVLIDPAVCDVSGGKPIGSYSKIYNNIFYPSSPVRVGLSTSNVYNNIFYNVSGSVPDGNEMVNPMLANPMGTNPLDAMLTTGSPAIDKATSGAPNFDYQNGKRPFPEGGIADIGAFEFGSPAGSGGPIVLPPGVGFSSAPVFYSPDGKVCPSGY